jgi:siroheme synthase
VVAAAVSEVPVVRTSCGEPEATGLTVSEIGVVCVADVPVPVTVTVTVPAGVEADVEIVNVELCPDVIDAGTNDADAPAGNPDALNATLCATPLVTVVLIVLDAD